MSARHAWSTFLLLAALVILTLGLGGCTTPKPAAVQYHLQVTTQGQGAVTPASGDYDSGTVVTLTATPDSNWRFARWEGPDGSAVAGSSIVMSADRQITAVFELKSYDLTTAVEGEGTVTDELVSPKSTYHHGDTVRLTATGATGWVFDHWTGDLTGSTNPADISVTAVKTITAVFVKKTYTLAIDTVGNGHVTETLAPAGRGIYEHGTAVQVTAVPDAGWVFDHWSGALTGAANPNVITVTSPASLTAVFIVGRYAVALGTSGAGTGTIQANPAPGVDGLYDYGTSVTLTASPAADSVFDHWTGSATGSTSPTQVTVGISTTVGAVFAKKQFALSVTTDGQGTVSANPAPSGAGTYASGTTVTLTATAAGGWLFDHWSGDAAGTTGETQVVMNKALSVKAVFAVDMSADPEPAGYDVGRRLVYDDIYDGHMQGTETYTVLLSRMNGPNAEFKVAQNSGIGYIVSRDPSLAYSIVTEWSDTPTYHEVSQTPEFLYRLPLHVGDPGPDGVIASGQESVIVPAGTFTAWRFDYPAGATPPTVSVWFVPGVGMVKTVIDQVRSDGTHSVVQELESSSRP